jgi:hypothetical protein
VNTPLHTRQLLHHPPRSREQTRIKWFWIAVLFVIVAGAMTFPARHPMYKWDYGAYVVASYQRLGHEITRRDLQRARSDIEAHTAAHGKAKSIGGSAYSRAFFQDTKVANEVIAFYRARVLFIQATRGLSKLIPGKLDRTLAVHALGTGFTALGVALSIWLARRWRLSWPWVVAVTLFELYFFRIDQVARLGHPDGAAFAFSVALFLAYTPFRTTWFSALCLVAPLVRPDLTVLVLLLVAVGALAKAVERGRAAALGLASLCIHVAVAQLTQAPSWSVLAYHSFVARLTHPRSEPRSISASQYLGAWGKILKNIGEDLPFLSWLALLAILIWMRVFTRERVRDDPRLQLCVVSAVYVAVHLAVFPSTWNRFFLAEYAITASVLLCFVIERWPSLALEQTESAALSEPASSSL